MTANVGIIGSQEQGGKTFYNIRWTDESGETHEVSRRYSEFDDLRKKLVKALGAPAKSLPFPKKKTFGNKAQGLVDSRQGELAAFLFELIIARKLVVPKDTGDSSLSGMVYDFLHGEEAM